MKSVVNTPLELLKKVETENLYFQLIFQLNKDFQLANIDVQFDQTLFPKALAEELKRVLMNLINDHYDDYLNLLYRIDIREEELLKHTSKGLKSALSEVSLLILKREYQKVWFKKHFR